MNPFFVSLAAASISLSLGLIFGHCGGLDYPYATNYFLERNANFIHADTRQRRNRLIFDFERCQGAWKPPKN